MQHYVLFFFAFLNFKLTNSKDLWTKLVAMRRKGVMFVLCGDPKNLPVHSFNALIIPVPRY